jgi:predicted secreted protein
MLESAGVRSFTISGSGVTRLPSVFSYLLTQHIAQNHVYVQLVDQFSTVYTGFMQIASIGKSAAHNGAELFEITLESTNRIALIPPNPLVLADEFGAFLVSDQGEPIAVGA